MPTPSRRLRFGYRRARLSPWAGGGAFGCGVSFGAVAAGSSFASAERRGSRRGAWWNLSVAGATKFPLEQGGLSDQDAVDIADYFAHQPRPDFDAKVDDWPKGERPKNGGC
jgi:hypothetical protein